ncbi:MAG: hypothetical protein JEZ06_07805 [Anaerolineaceae bacterium]|nr:hypothetical protein [Anaerolineaceae bacterium]
MKIVVPILLVPDLVEDLVINDDGTALDFDEIAWIINELDDHAIEQGLLIKDASGAELTVIAPDLENSDDVLYAASAKGADKLMKIASDFEDGFNNHAVARLLLPFIKDEEPDLVLTGVQSHNGFDGPIGAALAELMGLPYIGYVSGVRLEGSKAIVQKDYPGGLKSEIEVSLPVVLGIQSAEEIPRYVPFSKVRQAMKSADIQEEDGDLDLSGGPEVERVYEPEVAEKATMIEGNAEEIAEKLVVIFKEQGLL